MEFLNYRRKLQARDYRSQIREFSLDVETAQRYINLLARDTNGKPSTKMHKPKDTDDGEQMIPKAAYLSVTDFDGKGLFEKQIPHLHT